MAMSTPRTPWWLLAAGAVGWAGSTAATIYFDGEEAWQRWVGAVASVLASVCAAVLVGGGILSVWREAQWRRHTQWVLFELLQSATRESSHLVRNLFAAASVLVDSDFAHSRLWTEFYLPWSAGKQALVREAVIALTVGRSQAGPTTTAKTRARAMRTSNRLLEASAVQILATSQTLTSYLDGRDGPRILTAASQLHRSVLRSIDPGAEIGISLEASQHALEVSARLAYPDVLQDCATFAGALDSVWDELRRRARGELRETIASADAMTASLDALVVGASSGRSRTERWTPPGKW
jgi:hypothetical protein